MTAHNQKFLQDIKKLCGQEHLEQNGRNIWGQNLSHHLVMGDREKTPSSATLALWS